MNNTYNGQYLIRIILIIYKITAIIIQLIKAEIAVNGNYDTKLNESLMSGGSVKVT